MDGSSSTHHDDEHNSSGSQRPSEPPASSVEEEKKPTNFNVACLACRAVKTRCQNAGIGVKCSRCLRLKVPCEYREHRRGRRSAKPDRPHIVPPIVAARDPEDSKNNLDLSTPPPSSPTHDRDPHDATDRHHESHHGTDHPYPHNSNRNLPTSPFGFQHQDYPYSASQCRISDLRNQPRSPTIPTSSSRTSRMDLGPPEPGSSTSLTHSNLSMGMNNHGARPSTSTSHDQMSPASNSTDSVSLSLSGGGGTKRPRIRDYSIAGRLKTPAGLLEPERQKEEDGDDADHWRDPVSMGILSEADAAGLVEQYFTHLNPFIALLDSALHTTTYMRHRSSLLFSSVLAVTAKLCTPHPSSSTSTSTKSTFKHSSAKPAPNTMYRELLSVARRLLNEALSSDMCSLELIQSLSILTFWKECDDPTAWRKTGMAIRMAFELDLHCLEGWSYRKLERETGQAVLPDDEREAREVLNCERAWIQLVCFDRTISSQHLKPKMIPSHLVPDIYAWALSHSSTYPCLCDFQLAGANELGYTAGLMYHEIQMMYNQSSQPSYTGDGGGSGSSSNMNGTGGVHSAELGREVREVRNGVAYLSLLGEARRQHEAWRRKYRTACDPRVSLDSLSITMLHFYDLCADVKYYEALLAHFVHSNSTSSHPASTHTAHPTHLSLTTHHIKSKAELTTYERRIDLVDSVMRLLDFVAGLFEPHSGVMRNSQDVFTFNTADAALVLTKNAPLIGPQFVMSVRQAFVKVIAAAGRTAKHDKEAPAYLSRYFQQLLRRLNGQLSTLPSRAPSPSLSLPPPQLNTGDGRDTTMGDSTAESEKTHRDGGGESHSQPIGLTAHAQSEPNGLAPLSQNTSLFDHPGAQIVYDRPHLSQHLTIHNGGGAGHGYGHVHGGQGHGIGHGGHGGHGGNTGHGHGHGHGHSLIHLAQQQQLEHDAASDPMVSKFMDELGIPMDLSIPPGPPPNPNPNINPTLAQGQSHSHHPSMMQQQHAQAGGLHPDSSGQQQGQQQQTDWTQISMFPPDPAFGDDIYWLTAWPALSGLWSDGQGQ